MQNSTNILGVKITTTSEEKILEYLLSELDKDRKDLPAGRQVIIFTPNPEQISAASRDVSLKTLLNEADINLPDGVGIVVAARLLGKPIEARITGVDFMENLVKSISNRPVKTGYFGGQPGVAMRASECLQKMSPKLRVGYASDAYDNQKMMQSDIDILFVGLGFPKQEQWIIEHKAEIPATIIMAVGGSFDFLSGRILRAPVWVRLIGFEWLFRLILQPQRFWRQLRLLHFSALILWEAVRSRLKKSNIKNRN